MPRRPRGHTDCRLHHITTRGNNRRSMFEDAEDRERFYDLLDIGLASRQVECHQDVQMGNHVHLLLEGEIAEISTLLWFVSHRYALAYNQRHGRVNHLLGRRFYSSEVPDRYAARAVCIYIAMNPVRAGLCAHPREWQFGSYRAHAGGQAPRPHLETDFTRALFVVHGTTFEAATEAAVVLRRGGRPTLAAILPTLDRLTTDHARHARELFGFTAGEIASHYGWSAPTLRRLLASRVPS
ncbi:MAG: REP-associated tyrosine transposase [Gaiellaceae bacterium]|nr:REP-associated tyrosine transposase [Gaiellaceae bacterium]